MLTADGLIWAAVLGAVGVAAGALATGRLGDPPRSLSLPKRRGRRVAPARAGTAASGAHTAAGELLHQAQVAPDDLGRWALGQPIVVTRVVAFESEEAGDGYGWVCAECMSCWLDNPGRRFVLPVPIFYDLLTARDDLRYHAEHECPALEQQGPHPAPTGAIPAHLLYAMGVDDDRGPDPATCEHSNGNVTMPGEAFERCANCGLAQNVCPACGYPYPAGTDPANRWHWSTCPMVVAGE